MHCKSFKILQKILLCPDFQTDEFADFLITLAKNENIRDWVLIPSMIMLFTPYRETRKITGFL